MATKLRISGATPAGGDLGDQYTSRDAMHYLIVHGYTSPATDENSKAMYLHLMGKYGAPTAQKLFDQVAAFNNQNKGVTNPDERISRFYNTTISDPEVKGIITNLGGLAGVGYGKTGFGGELGNIKDNAPANTALLSANVETTPKTKLRVPK